MKNYIKPQWPAPSHIVAYTTTRQGGYSQTPFDQFNLGDHVGDDATIVQQNRQKLIHDLNLPSTPLWLQQTHSPKSIAIDENPAPTYCADAAYTRQPNQICVVLTADCLPILMTNRQGTLVAALHAGWRGLVSGVIDSTFHAMATSPDELLVWLGPAIGPNFFEVGPEVRQAYLDRHPAYESGFTPHHGDRWLANIYQLAKINLTHLGLNTSQIYGGTYCTYQQKDLFYSYRRDQAQTGRMATLIYIQ